MPIPDATPAPIDHVAPHRSPLTKLIGLAILGAVIFWLYRSYGASLNIKSLASQEAELRKYYHDQPLLVYSIVFAVYVIVTGLSLPGATLLFVSFASTTGATLAFVLSRYFLRDALQAKFADKLQTFNKSLDQEGAFYLFTLRLIPAVPFFVINVVMGLTSMRLRTYWWVSQIGMLPGTIVYLFAGSQFPNLKTLAEQGAGGILTPPLIVAFVVLGIFPIAVKKLMQTFRSTTPPQDGNE
jgi:uncharacterized membrane protein YdjX (TVP38/TMEM64 family)